MTHTVQIRAAEADLLSLERDLRSDALVRGLRIAREMRPPANGEMGPITEALHWASDNKVLVVAAFGALTAWVRASRTRVEVRIDGREVVIDSKTIDDPVAAAAELVELLRVD